MRYAFVGYFAVVLSLWHTPAAWGNTPPPLPTSLRVVEHGPFLLTGAYFAVSQPWSSPAPAGTISDNRRFLGSVQLSENVTAVPGVLALGAMNAFVTSPTNFGQPHIQSARLIRNPASALGAEPPPPSATMRQFGTGIRTWWSLIYTRPGTRFVLELTVRCVKNGSPADRPEVELHLDRWIWEVVVTFASLRASIDVLHSHALGTSEIPCIAAENVYAALVNGVSLLESSLPTRDAAQDSLFNLAALVIGLTAMAESFDPSLFFLTFPPGDFAEFGLPGMAGIIDTVENPCAAKILADLDKLAESYGIATPV